MSTLMKITHVLQMPSGLPRDVVENTFHFAVSGSELSEADITTGVASVSAFYGAVGTGQSQRIAHYLGQWLAATSGSHQRVVAIDSTDGTEMGEPIVVPITLTPTSGALPALPPEVAVCLSYTAGFASVARGRFRGRVYIGALNNATLSGGSGSLLGQVPHVSAGFANDLAFAGANLITATASQCPWVVFSRADGVGRTIDAVYVDNEFDTIRKRGVEADARVSLPSS